MEESLDKNQMWEKYEHLKNEDGMYDLTSSNDNVLLEIYNLLTDNDAIKIKF